MNRIFRAALLATLMMCLLPFSAGAVQMLVPGGTVIGLQLRDDTVMVAAFENEQTSAAKAAGLRTGDQILQINSIPIRCTEDVRQALKSCGSELEMTVRRGSKTSTLRFQPTATEDGAKLGVYLRQGIAGIGTVTFYDPENGTFGTLGHGVNDHRGTLLKMTQGNAYCAEVSGITPGRSGAPGQLKGSADIHSISGVLYRNTPQGVFGCASGPFPGEPLPVAAFQDIRPGPATIRSTVTGNLPRDYSVEILKIYPADRADCRNFLLKVTDPELLAATGGIVQGMSGSPIIQDGKLIGAVTHVLVNDPTRGYGIFIENMLTAAS